VAGALDVAAGAPHPSEAPTDAMTTRDIQMGNFTMTRSVEIVLYVDRSEECGVGHASV
jgi:hypothetical protein